MPNAAVDACAVNSFKAQLDELSSAMLHSSGNIGDAGDEHQ